MIVACPSCPAQYSVPDAKVRGKKVRVTCKHCGTGIVVDATAEPQREELRLEALEALSPPATLQVNEDATRMMPSRGDLSVHEEPTVIGHVPAAALEAERRYAQSTMPPPKSDSAVEAPKPTRALPHDVPEEELDITRAASPQAQRASHASLPSDPVALPPAPVAAAPEPTPSVPSRTESSPPLQPPHELKTLLSQAEPSPAPLRAARTLYWLVAALVVLLLALALMRTMR